MSCTSHSFVWWTALNNHTGISAVHLLMLAGYHAFRPTSLSYMHDIRSGLRHLLLLCFIPGLNGELKALRAVSCGWTADSTAAHQGEKERLSTSCFQSPTTTQRSQRLCG